MDKLKALWKKYFSSVNAVIRASLGLTVVFLFSLFYALNEPVKLLQNIEWQAYDTKLRATMPNKIDPRIVIIDVDERTLATEGRWPLARDRWVALLENGFDKYKLKVMGFDVLFTEPDTSSGLAKLDELAKGPFKNNEDFQSKLRELRPKLDYDQLFADSIKKYPVVLAFASSNDRSKSLEGLKLGVLPQPTFNQTTFGNRPFISQIIDGYSGNLPQFQANAAATGHILPAIDPDGILRRVPIFIQYDGGYYDSLSIATFRTFLDNAPMKIVPRESEGDDVNRFKHVVIGNSAPVRMDAMGTALIPYLGRSPMFRYISATDIMQGKLNPGELAGKIAIVGSSAQGLFDLRATPVGEVYPGVETHANMIIGYMDNTIKTKPLFEMTISVIIVMLIGIPLALALVKLDPLWSTLTVIGTALAYLGINLYYWGENLVLPLAIPLLVILTLYLLNMAYGFFVEARSKKAITGIFGTYVPKELVDEMAKNPNAYTTKGETREMTVLFSDVRSFTTISEGLSATELTALMNAYLTEMTKTIQADRGTIDKYIGDAIMAFWGAPLKDPQHAANALRSAMAMQQQLQDIAPDFIKRGWPKLEIGVGLNCGPMNVGDMGSAFRRAYTVMGDAVNLASRLESLTKEYGVGILVSENIVAAVPGMIYRELDRVRVKGKLEPITIYEPIGEQGKVVETTVNEIDRFHRALESFRHQRWDEAEQTIASLSMADTGRKVYHMYLERIAALRANPPGKTWDGVFTFTTK
ncbi:MAG: adenylate/guanylate cyclase domain-containing protein [Aeromicrobium sp.]|nr:adenylate/guanylate cyclase domain-containing protein [Burkholderiales bacterium]